LLETGALTLSPLKSFQLSPKKCEEGKQKYKKLAGSLYEKFGKFN
jgi:hypothetical protein